MHQVDDKVPKKVVGHAGVLGTCDNKVLLTGEQKAKICSQLCTKVSAQGEAKLTRLESDSGCQCSLGL